MLDDDLGELDIDIVEIEMNGRQIRLVSLSEIPQEALLAAVTLDNEEQLIATLDLLQLGLMDPSYIEDVLIRLPLSALVELMAKWSAASSQMTLDKTMTEKREHDGDS